MAFQYWHQRGGQHVRRTSFVSLRDAYHGDTRRGVGGRDRSLPRRLRAAAVPPPPGRPRRRRTAERTLGLHSEQVAAVVVEPLVQGAAGIRVQPPGYLRRVREVCDRHDVLLVCDEVATGLGRTGTMFACEQERVAPDLLCPGKGLTAGYLPLAATLTTERVHDGFLDEHADYRTFFHGHTFTGNLLACAAALASLEVPESERTLARLQPKIRLLRDLLEPVAAMPEVAEVRGRGMMVGIDLGDDPALRLGQRVVAGGPSLAARSCARSATSSC